MTITVKNIILFPEAKRKRPRRRRIERQLREEYNSLQNEILNKEQNLACVEISLDDTPLGSLRTQLNRAFESFDSLIGEIERLKTAVSECARRTQLSVKASTRLLNDLSALRDLFDEIKRRKEDMSNLLHRLFMGSDDVGDDYSEEDLRTIEILEEYPFVFEGAHAEGLLQIA